MTMKPTPGNQPDFNDMSLGLDVDRVAGSPAATHPNLQEEAEEEAARLGDFA